MYKSMDTAISIKVIRSSGCKPKSWELNYPASILCQHNGYNRFTSDASHNLGFLGWYPHGTIGRVVM